MRTDSGSEQEDADDDQGQQHLQLVLDVESQYDKKVTKALKQQLANEQDPLKCLAPAKGKSDIDLKRALNLKLA
jgi:hypothetical protein